MGSESNVRKAQGGYRWQDVSVLSYKEAGSAPFRGITRRILFQNPDMASELRYFEIEPGGHSTLERHEHTHGVVVLRGRGVCLIGDEVHELGVADLVHVPPMTWHQFRAPFEQPLGFLCMVNAKRDRPHLPTDEELAALRADPSRRAFLETVQEPLKP